MGETLQINWEQWVRDIQGTRGSVMPPKKVAMVREALVRSPKRSGRVMVL